MSRSLCNPPPSWGGVTQAKFEETRETVEVNMEVKALSQLSARPLPEAETNRPFDCVFNAKRSRGEPVAGPPENEIEGGGVPPRS